MSEDIEESTNTPTEKYEKLLGELEELDKTASTATSREQQARFSVRRAELVEQIAEEVRDLRRSINVAPTIGGHESASIQSGTFPDGIKRLEKLLAKLQINKNDRDLAAYVKFRLLNAEYSESLQAPKPDFSKIQDNWLNNLKQLLNRLPNQP